MLREIRRLCFDNTDVYWATTESNIIHETARQMARIIISVSFILLSVEMYIHPSNKILSIWFGLKKTYYQTALSDRQEECFEITFHLKQTNVKEQ